MRSCSSSKTTVRPSCTLGISEASNPTYKIPAVLNPLIAEPWWVNSIVRQPAIIPYTNRLRALDKVYLDTTFAVDEDSYRTFPTKAQGLSELLTEVSKFPENTVFHFNAWTLGYEEAWVALAAHLKSQVGWNHSTEETIKV